MNIDDVTFDVNEDEYGTYVTRWECDPPASGLRFKVMDEQWSEDYMVQTIRAWAVTPPPIPTRTTFAEWMQLIRAAEQAGITGPFSATSEELDALWRAHYGNDRTRGAWEHGGPMILGQRIVEVSHASHNP